MYKQSQLLKSSNKKIYQYILSAKQPTELLAQAIKNLCRKAIQSSEHFDFLLHRINWFQPPFNNYQELFLKILRIYHSHSKHSSKVIYNLIIQAFINQLTHQQSVQCFIALFKQAFDKKTIIQSLKENYPHKLCPLQIHILYLNAMIELCQQFTNWRTYFLQIIVQNLVNFDTQLVSGDQFVHKPFPEDQKIITFREYHNKTELSQKFDTLLSILLVYLNKLDNDDKIMDEILLVFQNKILPIKTTKSIQFIVLNIMESSRNRANSFISFLLTNLFDNNKIQNHYRIFTQSNFYLFSYILRSNKISRKTIFQTLNKLMSKLAQKLQTIQQTVIDQKSQLKNIFIQQQKNLLILQTIIMVASNQQFLNLLKRQEYHTFLENCRKKLHFQYFIKEEILQKININKMDSKTSISVKFSNKFLPSTLLEVGKIIDSKMKIKLDGQEGSKIPADMRQMEPVLRKMHKGQTPISFCTQTIV